MSTRRSRRLGQPVTARAIAITKTRFRPELLLLASIVLLLASLL